MALRDNWLGTEIATEAGEGDELSLALAEDAVPEAGNYFTGEFTVNGFSLGRQSEGLASWPVRDFFMPAYPVTVGAVQALRERLELDFAPGETCMAPFEAVQQMMISEATEELFVIDENGQTLIDLFGDGTAVLSVAN